VRRSFRSFLEKQAEPPIATRLVAEGSQILKVGNDKARKLDLLPTVSANLMEQVGKRRDGMECGRLHRALLGLLTMHGGRCRPSQTIPWHRPSRLALDKTAPKQAALFALNMLTGTTAGSTYSADEYATWLRAAGFQEVRQIRLPGPSSLMVGTRA
jgi:hypothetical protein